MEEFSFYLTVGSIILIQVSYFWLFRNDHYTRKMSADSIRAGRLSVVILSHLEEANQADQAKCETTTTTTTMEADLVAKLNSMGFIVYQIKLTTRKANNGHFCMDNNCVQFDYSSNKLNDCHQVVSLIEQELDSKGLKLHAYVSLPVETQDDRKQQQQMMQLAYLAYFGFLVRMSQLADRHNSRLVNVERHESSLGQFNSAICDYLLARRLISAHRLTRLRTGQEGPQGLVQLSWWLWPPEGEKDPSQFAPKILDSIVLENPQDITMGRQWQHHD